MVLDLPGKDGVIGLAMFMSLLLVYAFFRLIVKLDLLMRVLLPDLDGSSLFLVLFCFFSTHVNSFGWQYTLTGMLQ